MTSISSTLGKSLSVPPAASHASSQNQASSTSPGFESARRPSQVSPSASHSAPRKGQGSRKQHRNQRRPLPRGPNADEEDAMAEMRAVRNASSRRGQTSITHLLNYALPARHYYDSNNSRFSYSLNSRSYRRNPTWGVGSGHHAADKARYVHANYRFVVSPTGNYAEHAIDADKHLDWADVLQILASAESQQASCPICLSEPVAPRMARCGHIFCLPCLIRFMNTSVGSDDGPRHGSNGPGAGKQTKWRNCPICDDTIYISEVRPVRFYAGQESPLPRPGDDVVLRLMMRNAKSTLALPREGGAEVLHSVDDVPWHFAANVLDYARIMKGTGGYMEEQYDREIQDLLRQEKEDELLFQEDGEWTQRAIRSINAAKEKVQGLGEAELAVATAAAAASSESRRAEQDFYFYMAPPHLYLSPLDIRILKTKYGSFSAFPSTLLPRVEHITTGHVVDDALRRRAKYLGHLPYGCLISFLECDWTDIIPADILDTFADEIERRRKRNRDKAAQEERERLQAERLEAAAIRGARRQGGGGGRGSSVDAADDSVVSRFGGSPLSDEPPVDLVNDFQPLGSGGVAPSTTTPPPEHHHRHGFSHLANVSTSPRTHRTVWGTPAVAASPDLEPSRPPRPVDDGWLKEDEFLETLGAADLAMQMDALGIESGESGSVGAGGSENGQGSGGAAARGGGKKKKKQKITLMSTGGRRGL